MTVLQANLDALMAATGVALELPASDLVRVDSLGSHPSVSVRVPDGRRVSLHSQRDPLREADRLVAGAFADTEPDVLIVIGFGLSYILDAIEQRSRVTRVLAFEPLTATLRPMLERRDWREWLDVGRLTLLCGPEFLGVSEAWKLVDGRAAAPRVLVHPVVKREFPRETEAAHALALTVINGAHANAEARRRFAGRY